MDEQQTQPQQRPTWTYFLVPGAILIVGLLISGTGLYAYNNGGLGFLGGSNSGQPKTGTIEFGIPEIKQWAKKVKGLDQEAFTACLDSDKYSQHITDDLKSGEALGMVGDKAGTPTFFINGFQLIGAQPIVAFRDAIDSAASGKNQTRSDDHILGEVNAPVAIISYSDFQCPFCRKFFDDTMPTLIKEYVDTGKAKFVYRHFPLGFHPAAIPSAQATECAGEQGKFWEMHDAIFEEQVK